MLCFILCFSDEGRWRLEDGRPPKTGVPTALIPLVSNGDLSIEHYLRHYIYCFWLSG
jgi:hypothetical protein